jgi:hypothetical protein
MSQGGSAMIMLNLPRTRKSKYLRSQLIHCVSDMCGFIVSLFFTY